MKLDELLEILNAGVEAGNDPKKLDVMMWVESRQDGAVFHVPVMAVRGSPKDNNVSLAFLEGEWNELGPEEKKVSPPKRFGMADYNKVLKGTKND